MMRTPEMTAWLRWVLEMRILRKSGELYFDKADAIS
jgi:hypothetical protein